MDDCETSIAGLSVFRRGHVSEACPCLYEPGFVFITQGAKQMQLGRQNYRYDTNSFLMTPFALPASTQVVEADHQHNCLGFSLRLDKYIISEQIPHIIVDNEKRRRDKTSYAALGEVSMSILDAIDRLFRLMDEPESLSIMEPLIRREIHYRLLQSSIGHILYNFSSPGSLGFRITEAIHWMRETFREPLCFERYARNLSMSSSSFYHHFRQMTGYSPLHYQKWLRLNEARRLMLNEHLNAAMASFQVGYESPAHFNRDYKRAFGKPPKRDIEALRNRIFSNIKD